MKELRIMIGIFQNPASLMTTWIELKNHFRFSKMMFFHETSYWRVTGWLGQKAWYISKDSLSDSCLPLIHQGHTLCSSWTLHNSKILDWFACHPLSSHQLLLPIKSFHEKNFDLTGFIIIFFLPPCAQHRAFQRVDTH